MSGDQQVFLDAMNKGHSAAWDQEWEKACSYYRIAIDEFPENYQALTSLALALFELQKYSESLDYYLHAARVSPNDPVPLLKAAEVEESLGNQDKAIRIYLEVAELYARNKDLEKAIQCWTQVVAMNPEVMPAHTRLAMVYERTGRSSNAMVEYLAIASILQSQGNVPKAIQTMQHALEVVPGSKEALLAMSLLETGKPLPRPSRPTGATGPFSISKTRQAGISRSEDSERNRLDPIQEANQKAMTILAQLLFEQEEAQETQTRKGLSSIVKGRAGGDLVEYDQSQIIIHLSQAIEWQSNGRDKEVAVELERAMQAGLQSTAANYVLGFSQSKSDQLESAVANLRLAVQNELFSLGAQLLLALALYKMDQVKEASIEYLKALRIADSESALPDQAEELSQMYEPLIETFSNQADERLQKRICENISKMLIRPDWKAQTQIARQQLPLQPAGSAPIPLAEMLTEATSGQLVESLAKINQLARANKLLSAMEEAYYALKFAPTYLPLHTCIGDLLIQENRLPEAIDKYSIVARSYSVRGESARAINILQRVCDLNPVDMDARLRLIELLTASGKQLETVHEYIKLAEAYYNLADLASARKTYANAYRFALQARVDRELKVKILQRMADIDMQSLDWRNAIHVYEQVRSLDPGDEKARDMLFDLNIRIGQSEQAFSELDNYLNHLISIHRTTEALEYINAKILENPTYPGLYSRLAELYRLLGRKEDAIVQMEMAKDTYLQAGNRKAAIETLMTILSLNPTNAAYYQRMLVELEEKEKLGK